MAGGQVGPAVAAAHGGALGGRALGGGALAGREPAAHDAVCAEVARHVVAVCRW